MDGFLKGRNIWEIKIAGSLIVTILFLASSGVVIIFSEMEMGICLYYFLVLPSDQAC